MNDLDATIINQLVARAYPDNPPPVIGAVDAGAGRGVFSKVLRVTLGWPDVEPAGPRHVDAGPRHVDAGPRHVDAGPRHVIAKLPLVGPNGRAAARSGAYRREALAYRRLLPHSPIATPRLLATNQSHRDHVALLLEDLTNERHVDQLEGMEPDDAVAAAAALGTFHRHWSGHDDHLDVRRSALAAVNRQALRRGLRVLDEGWSDHLDRHGIQALAELVPLADDLDAVSSSGDNITLCHGDPRADNMVFAANRTPVLFDWQQLVVHRGEFDLAWLAATSLTVRARRQCERHLVECYGGSFRSYRMGFAIPALMALLLVQREFSSSRLRRMAETSLHRIGHALVDLEVADAVRGSARRGR